MNSSERRLKRVRPLLGTYVEIELWSEAPVEAIQAWITAGFETVAEIERLMSYHQPGSDLARLNRARPEAWIDLDLRTAVVLQASNELFADSGGVFDIRCGAALAQQGVIPPSADGPFHMPACDAGPPVQICGTRVRKTGPWLMDLGGIAKGYAVDCAVERIQRLSSGFCGGGIVNAGGDLRAWGDSLVPVAAKVYALGCAWVRPFKLTEMAVATSSTRRRVDGSSFLSPAAQIQMPEGKLLKEGRTVTVLADRCLWSDALTKVVLLGCREIARRCLAGHQAKGFIFAGDGRLVGPVG